MPQATDAIAVARVRSLALVALAGVLACAACAPKGTSVSNAPTAAAQSTAQWPMYNGSYAGDRYSELSEITPQNAARLRVACSLPLGDSGAFQAGPVVVGRVVYVTTKDSTYALDAKTCSLKWKSVYHPVLPEVFNTNRGVAFDDGKLYRGTQDGRLIALDATDGKQLWNVLVADPRKGYFVSGAPIVWNGRVFVGVAGADWGTPGSIMAFDASDGHKLWAFNVIPTGTQTGANTWLKKSSTTTGGGSTWSSFALDPQTGELFVPTGNPAPDFDGGYRPGDNLFTDSMVVLDASNGALRWWYQFVPHDTHDYDIGAAPALVTTKAGARLAVVGGKDGFVVAIDRTSHKAIFKQGVTTIKNSGSIPTAQGTYACPGWLGGVEWNGPAYDRLDNEVIAPSDDWCGTFRLISPAHYKVGQFFLAGVFVPDPPSKSRGWVTAVDADSGRVVWRHASVSPVVAAISPTGGGVTFTGDLAGNLVVLDSKSGAVLRTIKTTGALAGGIVTYELDGKQYVVFDSGNVSRSTWGVSGTPTVYIVAL